MVVSTPTEEEKKGREIPFGKPARIGNFKMWRTKVGVGKKETIEAIVISNLDGTWKVQIPQTYLMFRALTDLFSTEDNKDLEIIFSFITNFNFCTSISHGHFQDFLILAVYGYMHPEVLEQGYEPEDKKMLSYDEFMHRVKGCIEGYKKFAEEIRKQPEMSNEEYDKMATAADIQEQLEEAKKG